MVVEPDHDFQDEDADGAPEAELEDFFLVGAVGLEGGVVLGADVEGGFLGEGFAGGHGLGGQGDFGGDGGDGGDGAGEEDHGGDALGAAAAGADGAGFGVGGRGQDLREVLVLGGGPLDGLRGVAGAGDGLGLGSRGEGREPFLEFAAPEFDVAAGEGVDAEQGEAVLGFAGEVAHPAGPEAVSGEGEGGGGRVFEAVGDGEASPGFGEFDGAGHAEAVAEVAGEGQGAVARGDEDEGGAVGEGGEDGRGGGAVGEVEGDATVGAFGFGVLEDFGAYDAGAMGGEGDAQVGVFEDGRGFG